MSVSQRMEVKQGYVLRVNVCLTTNGGEARVSVESECLSHNEWK
jgi:hypothetical protein